MIQKQKLYIVKISDDIGIIKQTYSHIHVFKDKARMSRDFQRIKRFIMHKFDNVRRDSYDKIAIYTYDVSETEYSLYIAQHVWTLRRDWYDHFRGVIGYNYDIREVLDHMVDNPKFDISKTSDRLKIMNVSTQMLTLEIYSCYGFI